MMTDVQVKKIDESTTQVEMKETPFVREEITEEQFDVALTKSLKLQKLTKQLDEVLSKIDKLSKAKTNDLTNLKARSKWLEDAIKKEVRVVTKNLKNL